MGAQQFDLVVIGAGSGGVRAARIAAQRGLRTAIVEHDRVGGTCVIRGCVPKKLLMYASQFRDQWADARGFGWMLDPAPPQHDWPRLVAAVAAEVRRLEGAYRSLLGGAGVALFEGRARLDGPGRVQVGDTVLEAAQIVVATGARPVRPALPGADLAIVSDDVFTLAERPRRLLVVGGGFIALEFAGIFQRLGSEVVLAHRGALPLRGFDEDVRRHLAEELVAGGLQARWQTHPVGFARTDDGRIRADLHGPAGIAADTFDAVLLATGRRPATEGLGLAEAGVRLGEGGAVVVDAQSRTNVAGVLAVGDCTDRLNLTPVAIREGHAAAHLLSGGPALELDYANVPQAVFSQPPVGMVGRTEDEARAAFGAVEVYRASFRPMRATIGGRPERVLVKLVVRAADRVVVGAHMVGADAPEILQGIGIAVAAGLTKERFDATVGIHPTAAEEFVTLRTPVG